MNTFFLPDQVETFAVADKASIPDNFPTISMEQTHSALFQEITQPAAQCVLQADAIWTRLSGMQLVVRAADCLPILFYLDNGIIGVIHAGRRGTQAQITQKILSRLKNHHLFLLCWIGPHICAQCYEVDRETHAHFDLLKENATQIKYVFPDAQIITQDECTFETTQWHSYRREGPGKPMNYCGIRLK